MSALTFSMLFESKTRSYGGVIAQCTAIALAHELFFKLLEIRIKLFKQKKNRSMSVHRLFFAFSFLDPQRR